MMHKPIEALCKTYLLVRDLERAAAFYGRLGLEVANPDPEAGRAYFWVDPARTQCLVLREASESRPFAPRHVAFGVSLEHLRSATDWLAGRGAEPTGDWGKEPGEAIVHNWIPAASLSFRDPDGNHLELSARLPGGPIPDDRYPPKERRPLYLSEWERLRRATT
ncbi:MAG TPA: VOC family protein [Chloroflexota bacterium]|jgi:catechol 2,3-dioxygenase-like lactoylglutathione lyase family enzyme